MNVAENKFTIVSSRTNSSTSGHEKIKSNQPSADNWLPTQSVTEPIRAIVSSQRYT